MQTDSHNDSSFDWTLGAMAITLITAFAYLISQVG